MKKKKKEYQYLEGNKYVLTTIPSAVGLSKHAIQVLPHPILKNIDETGTILFLTLQIGKPMLQRLFSSCTLDTYLNLPQAFKKYLDVL